MAQSTFAGTLTAIFTLLTALVVTIGSIVAYLTARDARRAAKRAETKMEQVRLQSEEIHTIVNQQRTDMQRWIRVLERTVTDGGLDMPIDQSIGD